MALIVGHETVDQRLACDALKTRIEGGADGETAAVELVLAEAVEHLASDFLGEILRCEDAGSGGPARHAEGLGLGLLALLRCCVAILHDAVDHPVATGDGTIGMAERVVVARRLRQGRQVGGVGQGQLGEGLVPIAESGSGNAVGPDAR
ncbi:hypothetical protein A7A08_00664 [Methyloligella halotolerans]|uniref:Uncharacterized protein n=1 Tax=Methyloligella halotolerans TaxID=1177755 RepID=A0A1E2S353_9HYPH|nr:hypothetical protein A7A08_00664 [Methyloligella halotolerans]